MSLLFWGSAIGRTSTEKSNPTRIRPPSHAPKQSIGKRCGKRFLNSLERMNQPFLMAITYLQVREKIGMLSLLPPSMSLNSCLSQRLPCQAQKTSNFGTKTNYYYPFVVWNLSKKPLWRGYIFRRISLFCRSFSTSLRGWGLGCVSVLYSYVQ